MALCVQVPSTEMVWGTDSCAPWAYLMQASHVKSALFACEDIANTFLYTASSR